jgi:hypothetical protein
MTVNTRIRAALAVLVSALALAAPQASRAVDSPDTQVNVGLRFARFHGLLKYDNGIGGYESDECNEVVTSTNPVLTCRVVFSLDRRKLPTCTQLEDGFPVLTGKADYFSDTLSTGVKGTPISGGGVNGDGHVRGTIIDPGAVGPAEPTMFHIDISLVESCVEEGRPIVFAGVVSYL